MDSDQMTGLSPDGGPLQRGQHVRVRVAGDELGTGTVDDFTADGSIVWIVFGGPVPRRMFLAEDGAEFLLAG